MWPFPSGNHSTSHLKLCPRTNKQRYWLTDHYILWFIWRHMVFCWHPCGAVVKNPLADAEDVRDVGSVPGLGRSPGVGNGKPLQYSCLDNFVDRDAWQATVHGVTKNWTQLSDWALTRAWVSSKWHVLLRFYDLPASFIWHHFCVQLEKAIHSLAHLLNQQFLTRRFCTQGTLGDVWRSFWLS